MGAIVAAYLNDRERAGIDSIARRRDAWKAMAGFWAGIDPQLIDEGMARDYAARRNRAAATVRYELSMLSVALNWAKSNKWIAAVPAVWRPPEPDRRIRHLTRPEFRSFLAHVIAPHAQLYMVLAIATCARPGALLELKWSQVDFDCGIIDLNQPERRQTRKRRPVVPIADYARQPLLTARAAAQSDNVIERGGAAVASIKKAFLAASARSGIKATPYTLRHTGAVWRAEDGIPMSELAQLMGHDDSRTTEKHYARYSPEYLRKAANAASW